jgi:hypothetical protein
VPPEGLSPVLREAVQQSIRAAFVDSFRTVSLVSAAVLAVSTLVAVVLLQNRCVSIVPLSADNLSATGDDAPGAIGP